LTTVQTSVPLTRRATTAWVRKLVGNDGSRVIASQAGNFLAAFDLLYDG